MCSQRRHMANCRSSQQGAGRSPRAEALRSMLASYVDEMHSNEPVHTWEVR